MKNATIGAAVLGGYVLGRTKKAKFALSVGALLAGSQARPGQLGKALDSPYISGIRQQVRTELTDAGKAAATSVLTAKADSLAEALHERTAGLQERAHGDSGEDLAEEDQEEDEEEDEAPAEEEQDDGARDEEEQDETPARRGGGRAKTQHHGSEQKSEPRPKRKTAAASRSRSASTSRSRRQDDG